MPSLTSSRFVDWLATFARLTLFAILTAQLVVGCSTWATIHLNDGGRWSGKIERSDEHSIYITVEGWPNEIPFARENITDIDHPGRRAGIIGIVLMVVGIGGMLGGTAIYLGDCFCMDFGGEGECPDSCSSSGGEALAALGSISWIVGIARTIWGWRTYRRSRARAALPDDTAQLQLSPLALSDGERMHYGGAFSLSW